MVAGRCQTRKTSSITSFSSASKCLSCQRIKECSSRLQGVHHVYITGSVPTIMHPSIEEHHRPQPLNPLHPQLEHQATSIPLPRSPTSSRPHLSKNPKTQETMSAPTPHPQTTPQLTPPPLSLGAPGQPNSSPPATAAPQQRSPSWSTAARPTASPRPASTGFSSSGTRDSSSALHRLAIRRRRRREVARSLRMGRVRGLRLRGGGRRGGGSLGGFEGGVVGGEGCGGPGVVLRWGCWMDFDGGLSIGVEFSNAGWGILDERT